VLYLLPITSSTSWHLYLTVVYTEIAGEIINALVATKKHEILILSRKVRDLMELPSCRGVSYSPKIRNLL
jgi:hypothetical protein